MLEMINFVFPISASMASSSRWGSYSDSADDNNNNNNCLKSNIQKVQWTIINDIHI